MLTVVPTYGRHSNGEAQTFQYVPTDFPLVVVCRQSELGAYKLMIDKLERFHDSIWSIPDGAVSGIATTRQWIVDEAIRRGHSRIVMMDDDLHFIVRGKIPDDDVHLRPCDDSDFRQMIEWFSYVLTGEHGNHPETYPADHPAWTVAPVYTHAAVSMREGNNREPGLGAYMEASRGIRVVGYDLSLFKSGHVRFRTGVEGREDLDMTLQLLRLGHPNIVTYHWAQGQRSAGAPGGLSGSRTPDQVDQSAERLAELHPGLVKLRTKFNKSGAMAGERTEVTVYWKRALNQ